MDVYGELSIKKLEKKLVWVTVSTQKPSGHITPNHFIFLIMPYYSFCVCNLAGINEDYI